MAFLRCDIRSSALEQDTSITVVLPHDRLAENQHRPCRVVYLYHGIKLNDTGWLRKTNAEAYAEKHGVALIIPDASRSFYTDGVSTQPYYTYVAEELPDVCGRMFHISRKREDTFVAGLSMGGYGALKAALRSYNTFCAGAGFSSVCQPVEFALSEMGGSHMNKEAAAIWGADHILKPEDDLYELSALAAELPQNLKPRLYMCCGTEDPLYVQNINLKRRLHGLPLDVTFEEWQGGHDWEFWDKSIQRALGFFMNSYT